LAEAVLIYEELRAEVFVGDNGIINNGQTTNACQYQVFGDLVRKRLECDQEDVRGSKPRKYLMSARRHGVSC
jgi:hypothetical protein